jgi:hypothetical protein
MGRHRWDASLAALAAEKFEIFWFAAPSREKCKGLRASVPATNPFLKTNGSAAGTLFESALSAHSAESVCKL